MSSIKEPVAVDEAVYDVTEQSLPPGIKSVLMLEDDPQFSEMVRLFLESYPFRVTCVANGVEGLRQVMATDFDVILCDLVMPNLPGDMFYVAVQRTKKHLCKRFVFMTGFKTDPKWTKFLSTITSPVLGKPFSLADLLSTIQQVLTETALEG
ncbi:MAG TPA: response regulator [Verrucomicrobiae bacterium]|nr:response regulator [Verrucomicrobiae bacterium]